MRIRINIVTDFDRSIAIQREGCQLSNEGKFIMGGFVVDANENLMMPS